MKEFKRDYWAFCVGMCVMGMVFGYVCHSSNVFLINAILGLFDAYMWNEERKAKPE